MAVTRTITGNNDGSNPFDNQSNGTTTQNNSSGTVSNSSRIDYADVLTVDEINALAPEEGTQVYDSDNNQLRYYNGVEWKEVTAEGTINDDILDNRIIVNQENFLTTICGTIDSTKNYFLDGIVDIGANQIEVPSTGLTITGYSFDLSALVKTTGSNAIFTSPVGGSGNLLLENLYLQASGTGCSVFALTDATGFSAWEFNKINFIACTSLGYFDSYRQGLEVGTGRFGGTPTLEFRGNAVGGARISTSIVRNVSSLTGPLFKAGTGYVINGRFITDMNADLGTTASLLDFAPSNVANDESLIITGAYMARNGNIDPTDTTITPNITASDTQCLWTDNTGLENTYKFAQQSITTEAATTVSAIEVYYPLAGTFTLGDVSHFDSPANGQIRCLSGNDVYRISGNFVLDSGQNNLIGLRVIKSTDGGSTFTDEINHIERVINNQQGGRDVAYFQIDFLARLADGDIIRVEVENYTATQDITAELDSYLTVSAT